MWKCGECANVKILGRTTDTYNRKVCILNTLY